MPVPAVCAQRGVFESAAVNPFGARARWEVAAPLGEVAELVLDEYREGGDYRLAYDGFLDLLGRVWGCVLTSRATGWVEVVVLDGRRGSDVFGEADDDGAEGRGPCVVTAIRLGQGETQADG